MAEILAMLQLTVLLADITTASSADNRKIHPLKACQTQKAFC